MEELLESLELEKSNYHMGLSRVSPVAHTPPLHPGIPGGGKLMTSEGENGFCFRGESKVTVSVSNKFSITRYNVT